MPKFDIYHEIKEVLVKKCRVEADSILEAEDKSREVSDENWEIIASSRDNHLDVVFHDGKFD